MKKLAFAGGALVLGLLVLANKASAGGFKEGKWSMTTVIRMAGMDQQAAEAMKAMENMAPEEKAMMQSMMGGMKIGGAPGGGAGMSATRTQCLTNDNPVPKASNEDNCKETHAVKGNTINFETVCNTSHSSGQVTYKNDSMKGTISSTQTENGRETNATIDISGEYVGPC